MKTQTTRQTVEVRADGEGLVSHAGAFLLVELSDRLELTAALSEAMASTRERHSAHDPGVVIRDLAVADGGDHVSDLGVLRGQEALFGPVASESTGHRVIKAIDADLLEAIREARARALRRAWDAGARPRELILDIDASLPTAHSEKQGAAGTYKGGFGFFPLLCYLAETGEPLAGVLRPGNAGANTAADHFEVLQLALEQLPTTDLEREILVRADIGGRTHAFTSDCREAAIRFSVGYEVDERVRDAIGTLPGSAWEQAIDGDGTERQGAQVTELTDGLDLSAWPEGTRLIVRRERPHPGAQLSVLDCETGYRHTRPSPPTRMPPTSPPWSCATAAGPRSRTRSASPRRPGCAGCPSPPSSTTKPGWRSRYWPRPCCAERPCSPGRRACPRRAQADAPTPAHVAGRLIRSGRRARLRLPRSWPWAEALVAAFARLRALPAREPVATGPTPSLDSPSSHLPTRPARERAAALRSAGDRPRKERQGGSSNTALALLPTSSRPITSCGVKTVDRG